MSTSIILDVIIGLAFVFFVFSMLASGVNELVRKALNTRAKALWKSIGQILDQNPGLFWEKRVSASLGPAPKRADPRGLHADSGTPTSHGAKAKTGRLVSSSQLLAHPLIQSLDPARKGKQTRIHHIPNREFARAIVNLLTRPGDSSQDTPTEDTPTERLSSLSSQWDKIGEGIATLPEGLSEQFQLLYEEAGQDIVKFRDAIEGWFDTRMAQVSDWYKKRTRWALAFYGIVIAVVFNVSAIGVTAELIEDEVIRDSLVVLAQQNPEFPSQTDACADKECVEKRVGALVETGLPIWWRKCPSLDSTDTATSNEEPAPWCGFENRRAAAVSLAGWAVTAGALAMGASFWFATLRRALGFRQSDKA